MALYEPWLLIVWIVYTIILVVLWRLSLRIKNQTLKAVCWVTLILLTAASALLFFGTCLGIGYAGCM